MTNTVLGYKIASPEQQRKTALVLLGIVCGAGVLAVLMFFLIAHWETSGRQQAMATVTSFDKKCRYVVRNLGRRVTYYDHTGYIDCATAKAVAEANDNPLGEVQRRILAEIEYTTATGRSVHTAVELYKTAPTAVGERIEILYRTDDPQDAKEYAKVPLFGPKSIAPEVDTRSRKAETVGDASRKPPASAKFSKTTNMWIGFAAILVMLAIAYWLVTRLYRLVKWLAFGPTEASRSLRSQDRKSSTASSAQVNRAVRRPPRVAFGQR